MPTPIPPPGSEEPNAPKPVKPDTKNEPKTFSSAYSKPMTFLGMHFTGPEAQKLWTAIFQQISHQIGQEQKRALKAIRKLRKSETGEGD